LHSIDFESAYGKFIWKNLDPAVMPDQLLEVA